MYAKTGSGQMRKEQNSQRIGNRVAFLLLHAGVLGSMMVGQKLLEEKVASQVAELREFMVAKGIPKDLRVKIRRFMETLYEHKSGFDEKEVLNSLPPAMAQELLHSM